MAITNQLGVPWEQVPQNTTGQLLYTLPSPWMLRVDGESAVIVPRRTYLAFCIGMFVLCSAFGLFFSMFVTKSYLPLAFMEVVAAVAVVIVYAISSRQLKRGPWLVWHRQTRTLELPRQKQTVGADQIVAFQQVTGRAVFKSDSVTELNVLVREEDGKVQRMQVIGSPAAGEVEKVAIPLAREVGVPLVRVRENARGQITKREVLESNGITYSV